jgi:hypothetical protein
VSLGEPDYERVHGGVARLGGVAESAEDFFVFVLVFLGNDDERGRGEAAFDAVEVAAWFAGFGLGSAFGAVGAMGGELSW